MSARNLNKLHQEKLTLAERSADRLSEFVGSWTFLLWLAAFVLIWIGINVLGLIFRWDPYPFILLNLFLSVTAAVQAPIILMSQNRMEKKDRLRAELDFETNVKAEQEILIIQKQLKDIRSLLENKRKHPKPLTKKRP